MKLTALCRSWGVALVLLGGFATVTVVVEFSLFDGAPLRQDRLPSNFRSDRNVVVLEDTTRARRTSMFEGSEVTPQSLPPIRSENQAQTFTRKVYKQLVAGAVVQESRFSDEERRRYCLFLLLHTRKAPPSYCAWVTPNCTFPTLVTGLGGTGTHTAEKLLKDAGFQVEHENVNRDGSVGWMYAVNDALLGQQQQYPFGRFRRSVFPHMQCEVYPGELHAPRYSRVVHELRCPIHHISAFTSHDRRVYEFVWDALAYPPFSTFDAASSEVLEEDDSPASFDAKAWVAQQQSAGRVADDPRLVADIAVLKQLGLLSSQKPRDHDPADEFKQVLGRGGGGGNPFAKQHSKAGASRSSVLHHVKKHHHHHAMKEKQERISYRTGSDESRGKQRRHLADGVVPGVGWLDRRTLPSEKCLPSNRDHDSLLRDVVEKPPLCRVAAAARAWLAWNEHVEKFSDSAFRVEDVSTRVVCDQFLPAVAAHCEEGPSLASSEPSRSRAQHTGNLHHQDASVVPNHTHIHGRRPHWAFTMDDLFEADADLGRRVLNKAAEYGYWSPSNFSREASIELAYPECDLSVSPQVWASYAAALQ